MSRAVDEIRAERVREDARIRRAAKDKLLKAIREHPKIPICKAFEKVEGRVRYMTLSDLQDALLELTYEGSVRIDSDLKLVALK